MVENKGLSNLPEVRAAIAALSPKDTELLAAVQSSPFRLTEPEQFKEFAANTDYFVFEPNIRNLNDLGWRYLAQHMDTLLPPETPFPLANTPCRRNRGCSRSMAISPCPSDEWEHEKSREPEKKPSIRERLEQGKKGCNKQKAQPHKDRTVPEL